MAAKFLTAEWRKLIMVQYEVSPATLAPYLPSGLDLDFYHVGSESRCYVSLVGFLFDRVRVKGLAIPFHTRFEEINLRFYVRRTEADGSVRRGVVFIREFVPRPAIALVAQAIYEEPYTALPTRHSIAETAEALRVEYSWRHSQQWSSLSVEADPAAQPIAMGSEEEFITEHYWGYTKRSRSVRGSTSTAYQVEHPRWETYPVRSFRVAVDFAATYGPAFAALNSRQPASVLLAEGSAVAVRSGVRLQGAESV